MFSLVQGQKIKLSQVADPSHTLMIRLNLPATSLVLDVAAFGLDASQQLSDDRYMIFYNQKTSPCQAIRFQSTHHRQTDFMVDLNTLPPQIEKIVLTLTIDGAESMAMLPASTVQLVTMNQQVVAEFAFDGSLFKQEKALMLAELYQKDHVWRFAAIGQGFNGGLAALVEHFGGEVADEPVQAVPTTTKPQQPLVASVPPQPPTTVNLSKIILDKPNQQHRVNLNKQTKTKLIIEAVWIDNGDKSSHNDDLDLRVGLLAWDQKTMQYIHAPAQVGSFDQSPYVRHMGDVREASKHKPAVETVEVNPDIAKHFGGKVALVFSVYSAVSNGAVSIASLQPKMRMQYGDQVVECVFNSSVSAKAKSRFVYTYVIGVAIIDQDGITLQHSGLTADRFSESTPRLIWQGDQATVKVDGPSFFKTS